MDQGWQKYVETIDNRLERVESKMDSLLEFKWQIIGGGIGVSALVTIIIQGGLYVLTAMGKN